MPAAAIMAKLAAEYTSPIVVSESLYVLDFLDRCTHIVSTLKHCRVKTLTYVSINPEILIVKVLGDLDGLSEGHRKELPIYEI